LISSHNTGLVKHFNEIILLDKLSESLNMSIDIDTLADSILRGVSSLLPGYYYSLMYHDRNENWLVIHSPYKIFKDTYHKIQNEVKTNFEKLSNVKIEFADNVRVYISPENADLEEVNDITHLKSIWVPVLIDNGLRGLLGISGPEITNESFCTDILHIVAKRISGVLTNASLHKSTKLLALTDGLTGLLNRRAFYDRLRSEYERYRRYGSHLSLIVADFDNLKQINDNYGHPMGDEMIKRIGDILREASRESDVLARYGGDEFVIVLPQTNTTNALNMAERIRYRIENYAFALEDKVVSSTMSMGVATAPYKEINSSEDLLEAADKALYESKRSGKNRVSVYSR
jgi:diguanylate cyclase (GGDEF)-like protein